MLQKHIKPTDWHRKIRLLGHRITVGREVILNVLAGTAEHLSAEDIYIKVHSINPSVGLTTVYRTLELLVKIGMVSKFDFGDGRARFELTEEPKGTRHHHHLVCTGCSRIVDYSDFINEEIAILKRIEDNLSKKYNFKITNHLVQYYGLCPKCSGEKKVGRSK
jgi:Fur family ferric uptake transcriptional regulator